MSKERDYAGEPRSEKNPDLRNVENYERDVAKTKKSVEKTLRNQGDPTSDNDAGLSSKLPK